MPAMTLLSTMDVTTAVTTQHQSPDGTHQTVTQAKMKETIKNNRIYDVGEETID